jgi:hypothetical protein
VSLVGFRRLRSRIRERYGRSAEVVTFRLAAGAEPAELVTALHELPGISVRNLQIDRGEEVEVTVGLKSEMGVRLDRVLAELGSREDVAEMSLDER